MTQPVYLADYKNDNTLMSVDNLLDAVRNEMRSGELTATRAIMIVIDDTPTEDGKSRFSCVWRLANCPAHMVVAAAEYIKADMLDLVLKPGGGK